MSDLKRAGEIMIPLEKYPHIPYWFTLRQAMAEMEHSVLEFNGRQSLPRVVLVFDEKYRLMGLVRRRDILRGLEPEFLIHKSVDERKRLFDVDISPEHWEISLEQILEGTRKRAERKVSEIMRPIECTTEHDNNVFELIYEMNRVNLLPVMKEKRVVGVVRSVDVFHAVSSLIL